MRLHRPDPGKARLLRRRSRAPTAPATFTPPTVEDAVHETRFWQFIRQEADNILGDMEQHPPWKVLHVIQTLEANGAQRVMLNILKQLDREEWEAEVICQHSGPLEAELNSLSIPVTVVGGDIGGLQIVADRAQFAAVVHLHYWGHDLGLANIPGLARKLIVTNHTGGRLWTGPGRIVNCWRSGPVEPSTAEWKSRTIGIVNGIDWHELDELAVPQEEARRRFELPTKEPVFVALSRAHSAKGADILCDVTEAVIRERPDAHFVLAGVAESDPDRQSLRERERQLAEAGCDFRVLDRLPYAEAIQLLCAADVVLVTSRSEASPLVALEALGLGKPVIASAVGAIPQMLDDEHGTCVPVGDIPGFTRAALTWAGRTVDAQAVRAGFSAEVMAGQYRDLYRWTVAQRQRPQWRRSQAERVEDAQHPKVSRGRVLWLMAAVGCSGGVKVAYKLMSAMHDVGWEVSVASLNPWGHAGWTDWADFNCLRLWDSRQRLTLAELEPPYDLVVSTYQATMPVAAQVECKHRLALIQSDEPEWHLDDDAESNANFRLPGFQHVIVADHMREFSTKYGMSIVGQLDNGVDNVTFYPSWILEREWPHEILMVRKNAPVWFTGEQHAREAVVELSGRYPDFGVCVVGREDKPNYPCRVRHVQTFDENEMRRLYNSVSAVVIPSLIEGSSLVALEAMACGTPLVTTPRGVDYGIDGQNVLFVPACDGHAIAEAVSRIFEEPGLARRLATGGVRVARERTWEHEQQQWLNIIEKVMGGRTA